MISDFWEDTALRLLEMNLSGDSLNKNSLKELFARRPEILDELDIQQNGEQL